MKEAVLEVAAGVNSTLAQVTTLLRLLVSAAVDIVHDAQVYFSLPSLHQLKETAFTSWINFLWWLGLTPLQGHVLRALIIILVVNFVLIKVSWHMYAQRISHTLSFSKFFLCISQSQVRACY
nr:uncharacterized protein LOC128705665 [Cherax quadricarinatus]